MMHTTKTIPGKISIILFVGANIIYWFLPQKTSATASYDKEWVVGGLTIVGLGLNYIVARANANKGGR